MSSLLLPAENMALTIAREQVGRGEPPTLNVGMVLVMALDRIVELAGSNVEMVVRDASEYLPKGTHRHPEAVWLRREWNCISTVLPEGKYALVPLDLEEK